MQCALHRGVQKRRQWRFATGVRATELPEDLPFAGDRGIEACRDSEEVRHRGGLRADDDRIRCIAGIAQPRASVQIPREAREDLDAMTCDEREGALFDRLRHRRREPFARCDRRIPLVERPGDDCFGDDLDRMHERAGRKRDREICLTSRGITEDARVCQRATVTDPLTPCTRTVQALASVREIGMSRTQQRVDVAESNVRSASRSKRSRGTFGGFVSSSSEATTSTQVRISSTLSL